MTDLTTLPLEHKLQEAAVVLAGKVIACPHVFRCFDRSGDRRGSRHLSEWRRGLRGGTPDTELVAKPPDAPGITVNVELKRPGTKHLKDHQPTQQQLDEMVALRAAGSYADCAWSLVELVQHWRAAGVPLIPAAELVAQDMDLKLLGRAMKAAGRPKKAQAPRERKPKMTAGLRRFAKVYSDGGRM